MEQPDQTAFEQKDLERLKKAVSKSGTEKFYTMTGLMKAQRLFMKMKITHK